MQLSCNEITEVMKISQMLASLKSDYHLPKKKKICFICFKDSPLKMMKNAFYFILKALLVLKIFINFCFDSFGNVDKTASLER